MKSSFKPLLKVFAGISFTLVHASSFAYWWAWPSPTDWRYVWPWDSPASMAAERAREAVWWAEEAVLPLFGLFITIAVAVWGVKKVLKYFGK